MLVYTPARPTVARTPLRGLKEPSGAREKSSTASRRFDPTSRNGDLHWAPKISRKRPVSIFAGMKPSHGSRVAYVVKSPKKLDVDATTFGLPIPVLHFGNNTTMETIVEEGSTENKPDPMALLTESLAKCSTSSAAGPSDAVPSQDNCTEQNRSQC